MRTPLVAAFLLLVGCGQSYCERYAKELESCDGDYEATDEEIEACEEQMEPCSGSDERKLSSYNDCLVDEGAGFCPEDFEELDAEVWMAAVLSCAGELDGLSQECLTIAGVNTTGT
jgi:hypothetical protein